MPKVVRWLGISFGSLLGVVLVLVMALYGYSSYRFNRSLTVEVAAVPIPTDQASIERGRHLATVVSKCIDCHGGDLSGKTFIEDPALGTLITANLTGGKGGIGATYTDTDWVRAIRHGLKPDGRPALFMPAMEYVHLTDEDLGSMIAYLKSVPPVDKEHDPSSIGPLGRALYLAGQLPLVQAETIDHTMTRPARLAIEPTPEYGKYLANVGGCIGCHGPNLSGGQVPGTPPGDPNFPPATNLTQQGPLGTWSEADFIATMRTGARPDKSQLHDFMPWKLVGQMSDTELQALYRYLKTVPAQPDGTGYAKL